MKQPADCCMLLLPRWERGMPTSWVIPQSRNFSHWWKKILFWFKCCGFKAVFVAYSNGYSNPHLFSPTSPVLAGWNFMKFLRETTRLFPNQTGRLNILWDGGTATHTLLAAWLTRCQAPLYISMDCLKGKSTGSHDFYPNIGAFGKSSTNFGIYSCCLAYSTKISARLRQ